MRKWNSNRILVCSLLAIALGVFKYFVINGHIEPLFIVFELMSWLCLLFSFFLFNKHIHDQSELEEVNLREFNLFKSKSLLEREALQNRINDFEHSTSENAKWSVDYTLILDQFRKSFHFSRNKISYNHILIVLSNYFEIISGIVYKLDVKTSSYIVVGTYAYDTDICISPVERGIGLTGQVVESNEIRVIETLPSDYLVVSSGLGSAQPCFLYLLPISVDNKVIGLLEIASFKRVLIAPIWNELNSELGKFFAKD